MKNLILLYLLILIQYSAFAHSTIQGKILSNQSKDILPFVTVHLLNENKTVHSDANGIFQFKGLSDGQYTLQFKCIGYEAKTEIVEIKNNESVFLTFYLEEILLELDEIVIDCQKDQNYNIISSIDIKTRPHNTSQDLLRLVPGLFIGQHAGGGKAEQIFLRGFDVDHGTDVSIKVDGMPVNMVSHAHGQGYADLHFLIPETVNNINFSKGPYNPKEGDFNTAGAVNFSTRNALPSNILKIEAGRFNTFRGVSMINLLDNSDSLKNHNAYLAAEYFYSRSYFNSPQNFNRINLFGKYSGSLNSTTDLKISLSSFRSKWDASGQIPERSVRAGLIDRYGAVDDTEGGNTSRHSANAELIKFLPNNATIVNQLYFINYDFNLYSNFTFFLNDTINGDQIQQFENRNILGYNGSYTKSHSLGSIEVKSTVGLGLRDDQINNIGLSNTRRRKFLNDIKRGNVDETNVNLYFNEQFLLSKKLSISVGARFDHFRFRYTDLLTDTLGNAKSKNCFSPKFNLSYSIAKKSQLYLSAGSGFHSNDARVVVSQRDQNTLPKAFGADLGGNFKIGNKLFLNTALWFLDLESEFVYVGDEGVIEPSGYSRRIGIDISVRTQLLKWLYADVDINYTKPRFLNEPEGENYVPLAPTFTSIGGLSFKLNNFNGSLRYRYLGDRTAIEDQSIIAKGYFLLDAVLNYTTQKFQLSLTAENILNQEWNETQFATESRLLNEPIPVTEIHYTPGAPFFVKAGISYFF